MTDEQLYVELNRFVTSAGDLTDGLKQGKGHARQAAERPGTANALEASLKNIETVTKQLTAGEGSIGKLLKDDAFSTSLTSATGNMNTLVAKLNSRRGHGRQAD